MEERKTGGGRGGVETLHPQQVKEATHLGRNCGVGEGSRGVGDPEGAGATSF